MTAKRTLMMVGPVTALVAGVAWLTAAGVEPTSTPAAALPPVPATKADVLARVEHQLRTLDDKASAADVAALRAEVEALRRALDDRATAADALAKKDDEATPAAEQVATYAQQVEVRFDDEVIDATWGAETEAAIVGTIDALPGSTVLDVACRSTVCRVHLAHADAARAVEDLDELKFLPPFDTEGFVETAGTAEEPESIVYVARRDHTLFSPPPG